MVELAKAHPNKIQKAITLIFNDRVATHWDSMKNITQVVQ